MNTARSKLVIFVVAASLAALSGWLYAHLVTDAILDQHGIEYLFMIVLGGAWGGALLGATLVTVLKQWLQDLLPLFGQGGNFEIVFGTLMSSPGRPRRPVAAARGAPAATPAYVRGAGGASCRSATAAAPRGLAGAPAAAARGRPGQALRGA